MEYVGPECSSHALHGHDKHVGNQAILLSWWQGAQSKSATAPQPAPMRSDRISKRSRYDHLDLVLTSFEIVGDVGDGMRWIQRWELMSVNPGAGGVYDGTKVEKRTISLPFRWWPREGRVVETTS